MKKWLDKYQNGGGLPSKAEYEKKLALEKDIKNQKNFDNRATISKAEEPRKTIDKAWAIAKNPMTALEYKVKGKNIPEHFDRGDKNILEHVTDIINPAIYIDAASKIPGNLGRGEFIQAGANALSVLPVLSEIPGISNELREAGAIVKDLPKAKSVKEAIGRVAGIPLESTLPRMGVEDVKALRQVQEIGRLKSTNVPYAGQLKYALENNLPESHFNKVFNTSKAEAQSLLDNGFGQREAEESTGIRSRLNYLNRSQPSRVIPPEDEYIHPSGYTLEELDAIGVSASDTDIDTSFGGIDVSDNTPTINRPINGHLPNTPEWETLNNEINSQRLSSHRVPTQSIINPTSGINRSERITSMLYDMMQQPYEQVPLDWQPQQLTSRIINDISPKITNLTNKILPTKNIDEFVNNLIQDYPSYSGQVQQKVPLLTLGSEGSLKNVSKKVNFAPEGINSGDIFTGSTNTSHSSWLPQIKQVFKYDKGSPQFLGYKPMNSMGYLSGYGYEPEDIAKYLNSELDEQIKRGVIPKNIQRPYNKGEHVVLPQYGIKQNKNGGWLNKYNDSKVSLPPGFVGEGTFNGPQWKSPAWGGQFQDGGFLQPNSYKLPSGIAIPNKPDMLSSELATSIGGENGEPAYLIPSFKGGKRVNALKEYQRTGEHLGGPFKTWQEADKWEQEVRHPYVEKGQSIPSPYKTWGEMQMGGNLPGATGMMYARTGAPSNGKYAKKTKASAQDGIAIDPMVQQRIDYTKSPLYKERLKLQGVTNIDEAVNAAVANLQGMQFKPIPQGPVAVGAHETTEQGRETVWLNSYDDKYKKAHEIGHGQRRGEQQTVSKNPNESERGQLTPNESWQFYGRSNYLAKPTTEGYVDASGKYAERPTTFRKKVWDEFDTSKTSGFYVNDAAVERLKSPTTDVHDFGSGEGYGDVSAIRQVFVDEGITKNYGDNITPEMWDKALQNKKIAGEEHIKRMLKNYGKKGSIDLNNSVAYQDVKDVTPIAQDGKTMPKAYWTSNEQREQYRNKLRDIGKTALESGSDENFLLETPYHRIDDGNNCINGVCGLNKAAGLMYSNPANQDRYLGNSKFSDAVRQGKEDYYQVAGNFQVGDHLQYLNEKGVPHHSKLIYDITTDDKGNKEYHVIHNSGGKTFTENVYSEADMKDMLSGKMPLTASGYSKINIYRPGYNLDKPALDKERKAETSPEARAALVERKEQQDWDATHNPGFEYSIRPESKYYNNQPEGMKKFVAFANDDTKVTELAKKLGVSKDIIHDQLINTFGELGQENKWDDRWFGGTGGVENTIEKIFSPSNRSIGPGQIKYKTLDPELKEKFGIKRPKDLHDMDKVIPLMTAINVRNKQWMERQGENLSTKLVGTPGTSADEIKYGVDRWVPYAYQGLPSDPVVAVRKKAEANANEYRMSTEDRNAYINNYINNNIDTGRFKMFDKGSYAQKVYEAIDKNLQRTMPAENFEQYNELPPVTVTSKRKKMQNGGEMKFYQDGNKLNSNNTIDDIRYTSENFTKNWMDSPMYNTMLINSIKDSKRLNIPIKDEIKKGFNRYDNITKIIHNPNSFKFDNLNTDNNDDYSTLGMYRDGNIIIDKNINNADLENEIGVHETSHVTDNEGRDIPTSDKLKMIQYKDINKLNKYGNLPTENWMIGTKFNDYIYEPTETRARLNTIRFDAQQQKIYNPFKEKVNIKQLNKIKTEELDQLRRVYTDEQIVDLLNTVSKTDNKKQSNIAQNGKEMSYYQNGLDFKTKGMKKGGVIQDNRGQWAHPSKNWLDKYK